MHLSLPQSVVGAGDAYFVLEVSFESNDAPRTIEVEADPALEVLDIEGRGPGRLYEVPTRVQRLHVPIRIASHGEARASIRVRCLEGPEAGIELAREVRLEEPERLVRGARPAGKLLVATLVLGALGLLGAVLGPRLFGDARRIPNLVGLSHEDALASLERGGLVARLVEEEVDRSELVGRVVKTQPGPGELIVDGRPVTMIVGVARGDLVAVPDLIGRPGSAAIDALESADLQAMEQYEVVDDPRAAGLVRRQAPSAGAHVSRGTVIEVFLGRVDNANPLQPELPVDRSSATSPSIAEADVPMSAAPSDDDWSDAADEPTTEPTEPLAAAGSAAMGDAELGPPLPVGDATGAPIAEWPSPLHTPGRGTLPARGEGDGDGRGGPDAVARAAGAMDGVASPDDDAKVLVPDVRSVLIDEAERQLEAVGLFPIVDFEVRENPNLKNRVVNQHPAPFTKVSPASQVFLTVARLRDGGRSSGQGETPPPQKPPETPPETPTETPPETPPEQQPAGKEPETPPSQTPTEGEVPPKQPPVAETPPAQPGTNEGTSRPERPAPYRPTEYRTVPDVVASTREAAEAMLRRHGFAVHVEFETTDDLEADQVISQEPPAKSVALAGSKVSVIVSRGTSAGVESDPMRPVEPARPAPRTPDRPAPPSVPPGDSSGSPATARVPDVVARPRDAAEAAVRAAGLYYQTELEVTADLPEGQVISQDPAPGASIAPGGTVHLVVARRPLEDGVLVPNVVGRSRSDASAILTNERLRVRVRHGGGSAAELGTVTDQAPRAGTRAPVGSWVEIVVASTVGGARVAAREGEPEALDGMEPTAAPAPSDSSELSTPPGLDPGTSFRLPPPTPRAEVEPSPAVRMPDADAEATLQVPAAIGHEAVAAIEDLLRARFVVVVDPRVSEGPTGRVLAQVPAPGTAAKPGDLVRLQVAVAPDPASVSVHLAHTLGGLLEKGRRLLGVAGAGTEVVEIDVPGHPYAGSGRVAAQFPAGTIPKSRAGVVRLWTIR